MIHRVFFCSTKPLSILPPLTPPHLRLSYSAAASSPNRAIHCMASDSPLSQPLTGGDGSVSVPPPSPASSASSAIDFLSLCSRLKVMQPQPLNDPLRSGGLSDFNHLIPFMEWFQSSVWRLYDHACLCGIFGTNVRWICEFVCAWLLSLMQWCIVWWLLMFLFMDCW